MVKLEEVPKLTNVEVLDGLLEIAQNVIDRYRDTKNSIQINRVVEPDDDTSKSDFKNIQNQIKDIVGADFRKTPGSNLLIETYQELKLVATNDEEKEVLDGLLNLVNDQKVGKEDYPWDKSKLDKLFRENSACQQVAVNYHYDISSTRMNDINEFVTQFYIQPTGNSGALSNPRLILDDIGYPVETSIYNWVSPSRDRMRYPTKMDYRDALELLDMPFSVQYPDDVEDKESLVEFINTLDPSYLFEKLSSVQDDFKVYEKKLSEYEKLVTFSVSDFLEMFPPVAEKVMGCVEHLKKLVRKKVKVEVTRTVEVELDVADENDIETELSRQVSENRCLKSFFLTTSKGDYMKELSDNFDGVSVIEVVDVVPDEQKVA